MTSPGGPGEPIAVPPRGESHAHLPLSVSLSDGALIVTAEVAPGKGSNVAGRAQIGSDRHHLDFITHANGSSTAKIPCAPGDGFADVRVTENGRETRSAVVEFVVARFAESGSYEMFGPSGEAALAFSQAHKTARTIAISEERLAPQTGMRSGPYRVTVDGAWPDDARIRMRPRSASAAEARSWVARPPAVAVFTTDTGWTSLASTPHPAWRMVNARMPTPGVVGLR